MLTHTIDGCSHYFARSFAMRQYVVLAQHTFRPPINVFGRIEYRR